jgi:glucokinase
MLIDPNGPLCGCGRYGCLQAFSSSQALVRLVEERYRSLRSLGEKVEPNALWDAMSEGRLTGVFIVHEAHKGNEIALSCMKKIAVQLGIASSNLINILNPEKIIIGGVLSNTGPLLTELIRSEASSRAMESPFSRVNIEQSILGSCSGELGAASLALKSKIPLAQRWLDSRK